MAKNFKINIKNTQLAKAIKLDQVKEKLALKKEEKAPQEKPKSDHPKKNDLLSKNREETKKQDLDEADEKPRVRARSRSFFETQKQEEQQPKESEVKEEPVSKKSDIEEPELETTPPLASPPPQEESVVQKEPEQKLGPTGRHISDLYPKKPKEAPKTGQKSNTPTAEKPIQDQQFTKGSQAEDPSLKDKAKTKVFRDLKPTKKETPGRSFDARDRRGLRSSEDDQGWRRKRRAPRQKSLEETAIARPSSISVRIPIMIKDLASAMKLKASEIISKLFMQGMAVTLNDILDDETVVQLLGQEFGCEITIDTSEEERIRITDKSIKDEIGQETEENLQPRPPVITFMGHVDHGKTSLIDRIRKSNVASQEAGKITQHIGAFKVTTDVGQLTILDTPGHEAFSAMRARGAIATDLVVLVVAGDEGIKEQTIEAIEHAKEASVELVVAINKCDKPSFNAETVYRQLSDLNLLPEVWGGQTITVNCSAETGEGITQLLEMLVLQAEVLELKANPKKRARGLVLESEMHKGLGAKATVLVMNGSLKPGDSLVFKDLWGKVKTMHDQNGSSLLEAGPSTPVEITGLSGLPEAGDEFIVVSSEKEARDIAEQRQFGNQALLNKQKRSFSLEQLAEKAQEGDKKVLRAILRADVQGSLEAVKTALMKIKSKKVELDIISATVGEITESDVELARSSNAVIIGFHTAIESHAEPLLRAHNITVRMHEIIYHAIDDLKELMRKTLDKVAIEEEHGKIEVRALFKSSQVGSIAGCYVKEGFIQRNDHIRVLRNAEQLWKGPITSLRRMKDDVKDVQKGFECGIVVNGFKDIQEGDILESFEIKYIEQKL